MRALRKSALGRLRALSISFRVRAFPTPTLSEKSYKRYDRSEARNALGFIEEV
jgi:hypothetical protein